MKARIERTRNDERGRVCMSIECDSENTFDIIERYLSKCGYGPACSLCPEEGDFGGGYFYEMSYYVSSDDLDDFKTRFREAKKELKK